MKQKTMKNLIYILLTTMLLSGFLISCEQEVKIIPVETVEVKFNNHIVEEKTLSANVDMDMILYTYTAEPLFTLSHGSQIHGGTEGKEKELGRYGNEIAGSFTQGKWKFHVYGYNAAGALVLDGETVTYLQKKNSANGFNIVEMMLYHTKIRTGEAHFSFKSTGVAESTKPYVKVTPIREGIAQGTRTFYASQLSAEGNAEFDFLLGGLPAGIYQFKIELYDGTVVEEGGAMIATYILGGGKTEISGTVYPKEWLNMGFFVFMPERIAGSIGSLIEANVGRVSFKWTAYSGHPKSFSWYVNGKLQPEAKTTSMVYDFQDPGAYEVSCVARDEAGEEMGSSTATVLVKTPDTLKTAWTWTDPVAGAHTKALNHAITGTPLVRVFMEDPNGVLEYSAFPILTESGGAWTGSISYGKGPEAGTANIRLDRSGLTMNFAKPFKGKVTLEVSL